MLFVFMADAPSPAQVSANGAAGGTANRPELFVRSGEALSSSAAVSPDGKWFLTEAQSGALSVWSTLDGSQFRQWKPLGPTKDLITPGRVAVAADARTIVDQDAIRFSPEVP